MKREHLVVREKCFRREHVAWYGMQEEKGERETVWEWKRLRRGSVILCHHGETEWPGNQTHINPDCGWLESGNEELN